MATTTVPLQRRLDLASESGTLDPFVLPDTSLLHVGRFALSALPKSQSRKEPLMPVAPSSALISLRPLVAAVLIATSALSATVQAKSNESVPAPGTSVTEWSYATEDEGNENGPEHWGELTPGYAECSNGQQQSPINIDSQKRTLDEDGPKLDYHSPLLVTRDTGHTLQIEGASGNTMTLEGIEYTLSQVHLHIPSEHAIDGKRFAMEMHLVHSTPEGKLAIVAVMVKPGHQNLALSRLLSRLPQSGLSETLTSGLSANLLLPRDHSGWQYSGSLTTPPCTESVNWYLMKTPVEASQSQIDAYLEWQGGENARPLQR